jgi:hypothetical protein
MGRGIYRIYLYVVVIGALANAAFWGGHWLFEFFLPSSQQQCIYPPYPPCQDPVGRAGVAALLAFLALLVLGGSHYWWIRMDIAEAADAATGLVRSIALNLAQATAAVAGLVAGIECLQHVYQWQSIWQASALTHSEHTFLAASLAVTAVAVVGFVAFQLERQRTPPAPGASLIAQQAHFYLVQSIALIASFLTWHDAVATLAANATTQRQVLWPMLGGYALATFFAVDVWLLYFFLARSSMYSGLRVATQLFGFMFGMLCTIVGEWGAVSSIVGGQGNIGGEANRVLTAPPNFAAFLVFGVLIMVGYGFWLAREADQNPLGRAVTELTILAVSALVLGVAFYIGATMGLAYLVHVVSPRSSTPDNQALWLAMKISAIGLFVAGLAHPFMALILRQQSLRQSLDHRAPRQGFVLAALAAGFLTIAFAFVLLQIKLIGPTTVPVTNPLPQLGNVPAAFSAAWNAFWKTVNMCTGNCSTSSSSSTSTASLLSFLPPLVVATVLVGLFIAVTHLWWAFREGWLPHLRPPTKSAAPQTAEPPISSDEAAFGAVVDDLLADQITRDQAIAQMRALARRGEAAG